MLASVIINALNSFSVSKIVLKGTMLNHFELFKGALKTFPSSRLKTFLDFVKSSLEGKEVFIATNMCLDTMTF